jgi:Flp pilus assembly pilin Flp
MHLHDDSGQSTIEWLALMAMLVALAGLLVTAVPGIGDTIVTVFDKLIRSVSG